MLIKLLRGAWTEGLGAIHPVLNSGGKGKVVRPFLETRRSEVEIFLRRGNRNGARIAQTSTRTSPVTAFAINYFRHCLEYNPRLRENLANLSATARDEEAYWQAELADLLPMILLPGKPVRGGGPIQQHTARREFAGY